MTLFSHQTYDIILIEYVRIYFVLRLLSISFYRLDSLRSKSWAVWYRNDIMLLARQRQYGSYATTL